MTLVNEINVDVWTFGCTIKSVSPISSQINNNEKKKKINAKTDRESDYKIIDK